MPKKPLPQNTRICNGRIQFRKLYRGQYVSKSWLDTPQKRKDAFEWIRAMLAKMDNGEYLGRSNGRISMSDAIDAFLKLHGPSYKGGITTNTRSSYYVHKSMLGVLKLRWAGRYLDTITMYDVRDFLLTLQSVGNRMKYLGLIGKLFREFDRWNAKGNILKFCVKLPPRNPATEWRAEMKPGEKKELPRKRVLAIAEWEELRAHLKPRCLAICEIALRRLLRKADIVGLTWDRELEAEALKYGRQAKTSSEFAITQMEGHTGKYDFKNFRRDFETAVKAAGLEYPKDHPLHFTFLDLRRTGATWMWRKGIPIEVISKALGHTDLETTQRYLSIRAEEVRGAFEVLDETFGHKAVYLAENLAEIDISEKKSDVESC